MAESYDELTPKQKKAVQQYAAQYQADFKERQRAAFEAAEKESPSRTLEERLTRRLAMSGVGNSLPKMETGWDHVSRDPLMKD